MENRTYYLSNGQEVYLQDTIGDKFIVTKIYSYYDEYIREEIEIEDKNSVVVDKIYQSPPKEKISKELIELESNKSTLKVEISKLKSEKYELANDIKQLQKTQISNNKLIINKSDLINATTLALFPSDRVMPLLLENKNSSFKRLKLTLEISLSNDEERAWGYKLYDYNDSFGCSQFLCPKYGVLINPTQEQIDETILKRLTEVKFSDYNLKDVPDKYLTGELLLRKQVYNQKEKDTRITDIQNQLQRLNNELSKLEKNNDV